MTVAHDIIIATVVGVGATAVLVVGDPVYIALIALVSAIVVPITTTVLAVWFAMHKVGVVDTKVTKIGMATDGINTTLNKELAVLREENRGLRELNAVHIEAKLKADAVSLAMATTATPASNDVNVGPLPLPVEVVADQTKETK